MYNNGCSPLLICLFTTCVKPLNLKLLEDYLETLIRWNMTGFHFNVHETGLRLLRGKKIMEGSDGKQWRTEHFINTVESSRDTGLSDCLEHFG